MKNLIITILTLIILSSLVACGNNKATEQNQSQSELSQQTQSTQTTNEDKATAQKETETVVVPDVVGG